MVTIFKDFRSARDDARSENSRCREQAQDDNSRLECAVNFRRMTNEVGCLRDNQTDSEKINCLRLQDAPVNFTPFKSIESISDEMDSEHLRCLEQAGSDLGLQYACNRQSNAILNKLNCIEHNTDQEQVDCLYEREMHPHNYIMPYSPQVDIVN